VFIIVFPVPIRVAAIMLTAVYLVVVITKGYNAGGDAAHLAGMAAGAIYVLSESWRANFKTKLGKGAWERKLARQQETQEQINCILDKIHKNGMHSLTQKERKLLRQATEAEQQSRR
jgi:hypothetical protein